MRLSRVKLASATLALALGMAASASAATPTVTEVSCAPAKVAIGKSASCTASVEAPSQPQPFPLGTVRFEAVGPKSSAPAESSCQLALPTGGSRCKVSYRAAGGLGVHTITATYEPSTEHDPSSDTTTVRVIPPPKKCKRGKKLKKVEGSDGVVRTKCVRAKKKRTQG